jgi:hypothetical protein
MKRAATSISWLCAIPHSSEVAVNTPGQEHTLVRDEILEPPGKQQAS